MSSSVKGERENGLQNAEICLQQVEKARLWQLWGAEKTPVIKGR
jgi:hypothetical protein